MKYLIKKNGSCDTVQVFGETKFKDSLQESLTAESVTLKDLQDAGCSTLEELHEKIIRSLRDSADYASYAHYVTSNFTINRILTLNINLEVNCRSNLTIEEYDMDVDDVVDILLLYVGYVNLSLMLDIDDWYTFEDSAGIREAQDSITSKIASYIESHITEGIKLCFDGMTIKISETC